MATIKLWHGGRNLENNYRNYQPSKKGNWEHGPGLYLTTHYDTAYTYAKGGGKTYQVEVEIGRDIKDVLVDISLVNEFVCSHITKSKAKNLLKDLYSNMHHRKSQPKIHIETLVNLVINNDALVHSKTHLLTKFLVDNGVDYGMVNRFKGREEVVMVVYNKEKIKKVNVIPAKNVNPDQWILTILTSPPSSSHKKN